MRIGLQLAQEELAQLLGASRQRVNQELKGIEREGAVRIEPTRLVVLSTRQAAGDRRTLIEAARLQPRRALPIRAMSTTRTIIGTRPVAEQHAFDIAALEALPRARTSKASPARSTVEQFKGGQSNPTYKLRHAGAQPT